MFEMSVKLKFQCVCLEKKHWFVSGFSIGFLFLFIKAQFTQFNLYHTIVLYFEDKEMIYKSVNLKGVCTSQNKTLSTFSLSLHAQVLQTFLLLYSSKVTILRGVLTTIWLTGQCNWFHNNQVMQSTGQTGVENARLEFSGKAGKWLLGNIKYFVSSKLKSLKSSRQNITLSKHLPLTNTLFGSLDWSLMLETRGIGKNEKSLLKSLSSFYPKIESIACNIWCLSEKLQVCSCLGKHSQNTRDFCTPNLNWTCPFSAMQASSTNWSYSIHHIWFFEKY